jgi:hypothetical protein
MASGRLEALLEISDTIIGILDLNELRRSLAQLLKQAVDFDYVAILLHRPETDTMELCGRSALDRTHSTLCGSCGRVAIRSCAQNATASRYQRRGGRILALQ